MEMSRLIRNATIVTQDENRSILNGDIFIQDGRIVEVSEKIKADADSIIDARGMIAIPGLVNCHTHMAMSIYRGYGENLPLDRWLREKIWPIEALQTAEHAKASAMLSFCEMIRSGTTCFAEMCIVGAKEIRDVAKDFGIRGIISQGLMDKVPGKTTEGEIRLMKESHFGSDGLIRSSVGPHSPYTCSKELLSEAIRFSREKGIRCQIHTSETRSEVLGIMDEFGEKPLEYLDSLGLVGKDVVLSHASWVSKREIELAGKNNVSVCSCPVSNLKLATGGICPLREYDFAGANVVLGTDGAASNNCLDMFQTMKISSLLQKHKYWKANAIDTGRFLDYATINGARALGFDCGSISAGALADIVLLGRDSNMIPEHDIISNIVYSCNPGNVRDVFVGGKRILSDGKFTTVDEDEVRKKAVESAEELAGRA
jgi:5-methylthioadenosine/S-adenosylhomocysteine deaminase